MGNGESSKLRFDFIDLVFALAIGQVGVELGDFYSKNNLFSQYPYVFTHLLLCVYVISSSWIGWNVSQSKGNQEDLKGVFSISFLILLFDLLLVFCYFIMVRGVEKPDNTNPSIRVIPESHTEARWSVIIFIFYFVWDVFSKLVTNDFDIKRPFKEWNNFKKRGYQSLICIGLVCLLDFVPFNTVKRNDIVESTDIALLGVFMLFRGLKAVIRVRDVNGNPTEPRKNYFIHIYLPLLLFIIPLVYNYINYHV